MRPSQVQISVTGRTKRPTHNLNPDSTPLPHWKLRLLQGFASGQVCGYNPADATLECFRTFCGDAGWQDFLSCVSQGEIPCTQQSVCAYGDTPLVHYDLGPFIAIMAKWSACSKFALRAYLSRIALLADKPLFSNVNVLWNESAQSLLPQKKKIKNHRLAEFPSRNPQWSTECSGLSLGCFSSKTVANGLY